jgi:hypothetical protein
VINRRWLIGAGLALVLGGGGWFGYSRWHDRAPSASPEGRAPPRTALDEEIPSNDVTTIDMPSGVDPSYGATPMAQRVAVVGLLNKRNGVSRDLTLKPGQAVRVGDVVVRLRACERTAPWEQQPYTGAFVQVDVAQPDKSWRRIFSGWLYKERPQLNVVLHPIYDVWTKSCEMTFPEGGPDSVSAGSDGGKDEAAPRSRAKKSPAAPAEAAPDATPTTPSIAPVSNAT